jgi:hypothetical protein
VIEKRRHARAVVDLPVQFARKGGSTWESGVGKDISLGGMFIETASAAPFGSEIVVRVELRTAAGSLAEFDLPAIVRWVRSGGMGVQFGSLGVHETHAITEVAKPQR